MKIAVAGTGYVGLSISCLIAQHHTVCAVDLIKSKVDSINNRKSPIQDEYIEKYPVPQPPERCLSRQAGIVRCCLCLYVNRTIQPANGFTVPVQNRANTNRCI